jgi:hypothetical protein
MLRANKFANIILSGGILYFISVLVYLWIIYFDWNKYALVFSVIAIMGIIICSFAFKLRSEYKINLVLTGLSILFGLYLVEIFLSFEHPNFERIKLAKKMEVPFDARTRREVIVELRERGVNALRMLYSVHHFSHGLEKIRPLGGMPRKTTVLCNESGEWTIYESDKHGFNNPVGLFEVDRIDIMLIGDSYTQGDCVKQGEDIASQLRTMSKIKAINLGIGGNGPLKEFATLKEYGEPLKPKYVLWMYSETNDLRDLKKEQQSLFLLKYLDNRFSQHLISKQSKIEARLNELLQEYKKEKSRRKIIASLRNIIKFKHLRKKLGIVALPSSTPNFKLFTKVLENARKLTSSWGGKLYFVYLPSWERYAKDVEHGTFYYRNKILSLVQNLKVPIIDMHQEIFIIHPDPLSLFPLRDNGHYTSEGYSQVAQTIHAHLKKEGL